MENEPEVLEISLLEARYDGPKEIKIATSDGSYALFVIPIDKLADYRKHSRMNQSGIYMMLGDLNLPKPSLYIGQARKRKNGNGTIYRIIEHINRGEHLFCKWAILLVDSPTRFGATELNTLENNFTKLAVNAARTEVCNGYEPSASEISRTIKVRLNRIIKATRLMLGTVGILVLEPDSQSIQDLSQLSTPEILNTPSEQETTNNNATSKSQAITLHMVLRGVPEPAWLLRQDNKYILKAGSSVKTHVTSKTAAKIRAKYDGGIANGKTTVDIVFGSASTAATYVSGNERNGNRTWRTEDNVLLGDLDIN